MKTVICFNLEFWTGSGTIYKIYPKTIRKRLYINKIFNAQTNFRNIGQSKNYKSIF